MDRQQEEDEDDDDLIYVISKRTFLGCKVMTVLKHGIYLPMECANQHVLHFKPYPYKWT